MARCSLPLLIAVFFLAACGTTRSLFINSAPLIFSPTAANISSVQYGTHGSFDLYSAALNSTTGSLAADAQIGPGTGKSFLGVSLQAGQNSFDDALVVGSTDGMMASSSSPSQGTNDLFVMSWSDPQNPPTWQRQVGCRVLRPATPATSYLTVVVISTLLATPQRPFLRPC